MRKRCKSERGIKESRQKKKVPDLRSKSALARIAKVAIFGFSSFRWVSFSLGKPEVSNHCWSSENCPVCPTALEFEALGMGRKSNTVKDVRDGPLEHFGSVSLTIGCPVLFSFHGVA